VAVDAGPPPRPADEDGDTGEEAAA
jgi:hypothetical protein